MGLIDSHAHLTFPELSGQLDAVLARCRDAGVDRILTVGTRPEDIGNALAIAESRGDMVSVIAGFHPHEAEKIGDSDLAQLGQWWNSGKVVGCGEMGLDYHYDFADRATQRRVFMRQLEMAADRDMPVVIHSREAIGDTVVLLAANGYRDRRVVFHCFTGTAAEADLIAEHGWRISFTGIVTFKNSNELQAIARRYPADQLMVETDSPYLSPMPVRHKRPCEPSYVAHTARFLAELRGEDFDEFVTRTAANTRSFFGLDG